MKIRLLSDLHMEGYKYYYEWAGEDALILAGDIHNRNRHHELLDQIPPNVTILFVAGNHEYYHGNFQEVNNYLKELEVKYHNFEFLDNRGIGFDGLEFFGGTMFTDFGLYGETERWFAEHAAQRGINDFGAITTYDHNNELWDWNIKDHKAEHAKFVRELQAWKKATEGKRRIVITHFMPTEKGNDPRFANSMLNPYFTENMYPYMAGIEYWFCGHGHATRDVDIDGTRVIMNPRGYGHENEGYFNPNFILEI